MFLEPLAKNTVRIQWHHAKYGIGCLTVLVKGPGRDLLEPRDDCPDNNRAQQFRIERFGSSATTHFRIRPVITGRCLSALWQTGSRSRCAARMAIWTELRVRPRA
ncbi:hypothetical protein ACIO6T_45270 [Streptomyces sp. NPDC087532]|uniref:hypothetical protein n=1 Tax=unclassified Streptomyces TaxID=2593676 RepID=UPI003317FF85